MRKPIIAGNWKMNKTAAEAVALINELKPLVAKSKPEVVICVPYTEISKSRVMRCGKDLTKRMQASRLGIIARLPL